MNAKRFAAGCMLQDLDGLLPGADADRTVVCRFLKEHGIEDEMILEQVRFCEEAKMAESLLKEDSPAYLTGWADDVATGIDERERSKLEPVHAGEELQMESIFNHLNHNSENNIYEITYMKDAGSIPCPIEHSSMTKEKLNAVRMEIAEKLGEGLRQVAEDGNNCNGILSLMETYLSYIPAAQQYRVLADVSLYDHARITAAVGSCLLAYLQEKGITNYRKALSEEKEASIREAAFLMVCMDTSGIQEFIYLVHSKGALKSLRAKSFYLEILLEHAIDVLLERTGLSRANLIYSGGGHAYLLLPNTEEVKQTLTAFHKELTEWFMENFRTDLYIGIGQTACSAGDLMDAPRGTYEAIYTRVSQEIMINKASRYNAAQLRMLNRRNKQKAERECKVCGRTDRLTEEDTCELCAGFREISSSIMDRDYVYITDKKPETQTALNLPFGCYMTMVPTEYVRKYSINKVKPEPGVNNRLWVGSYKGDAEKYAEGTSFGDLAGQAEGVQRLGVLRADVDNLGTAFVNGFERENPEEHYVSLSRSATFSRRMNTFFKYYLNGILEKGSYTLTGGEGTCRGRRNVLVVYSGGDDLFLVGAWNEIIEAAIDIQKTLKEYTQGTLTISAGIGIFPKKYPVKDMARQVGEMEEASKAAEGKNSITLFSAEDGSHTYHCDVFRNQVLGEKYKLINRYFSDREDKGMSAVYKLLGYVRGLGDTINLARLAYMLGRLEPKPDAGEKEKMLHEDFVKKFYRWISGDDREEDRRQLITALYIYVYLNREVA